MSVERSTVAQRKAMPIASGVLDYFPDALLVVAEVSRIGNEQHHPGEPLHWDKSKSSDEADALMRHLLDRGTLDTDGVRHSAKVAWRALALLQRELDAEANTTILDMEALRPVLAVQEELMRLNIMPTQPVLGADEPLPKVYGMERFEWDGYGGRWKFRPDRASRGCGWCGLPGGEHVINCPAFHAR
jgi:hypothetical protein